jgi:hypothetical protein
LREREREWAYPKNELSYDNTGENPVEIDAAEPEK